MNTSAKLGAYLLGLAVIFGGALGAGNAVGAAGPPPAADGHGAHGEPVTGRPSSVPSAGSHGTHDGPTSRPDPATAAHIPEGFKCPRTATP